MNRSIVMILLSVIMLLLFSCGQCNRETAKLYPESFEIRVINQASIDRPDEIIDLEIDRIKKIAPQFNPGGFTVLRQSVEIPSQADDLNRDGLADHLFFADHFNAKESKTYQIRYNPKENIPGHYSKRTQAKLSVKTGGKFRDNLYIGGKFQDVTSLRVPDEHAENSNYIRYEGPGWESDRVAYRFYLDRRNATDIFGKKNTHMILQDVGQDGLESYHSMTDWGMDILKVGSSLGIGSIGIWVDGRAKPVSITDSVACRIVASGPVYSQIQTHYFGWRVNHDKLEMVSNLSITAGSRLTLQQIQISDPVLLCTGIVKHPGIPVTHCTDSTGEWACMATWGKQSLADDSLGLAVFFRNENFIGFEEDQNNHVVVLKPDLRRLTYYFAAAWEQEFEGIRTEAEFIAYLHETILRLNQPLLVQFN